MTKRIIKTNTALAIEAANPAENATNAPCKTQTPAEVTRSLSFVNYLAPMTKPEFESSQKKNLSYRCRMILMRYIKHKKRKRKKVDPVTGKPSTADNAISQSAFRRRKKVDPVTGEPSTADNAISQSAFRRRKKVDPITGKPSTADNSIRYSAFTTRKSRKRKLNNSGQENKKAKRLNVGLRVFDDNYRKKQAQNYNIKQEVNYPAINF